jgi:hypothetical protein
VVDRLRLLLNRPLIDADRPRLFAIAAALIVAAALVLTALDDAGPAPERDQRAAPAAAPLDAPTDVAGASSPSPAPKAAPPSEEGTPAPGAVASRADVAHAKRAARRFLAGYLPYTYGQRAAREIADVDPELRRRLASDRPRVPPQERRRRPRLELLHADGAGRDRARMVALVSDGRRRYIVDLELARTSSGWHVTAVGS